MPVSMSGSSRKKEPLPAKLIAFSKAIIYGQDPASMVRENSALIDNITPSEVISLVDELVGMDIPLDELKSGINKILNLFYRNLNDTRAAKTTQGSFLDILQRNNAEMAERLKNMRPLIRKINKNPNDVKTKQALLEGFTGLKPFDNHYVIKENVLFPALEKQWPDYRCLQVMWSFHDDIRNNRKQIVSILKKAVLDLPKFNKLAGDLFFNMLAIKFREEKILFPVMLDTIPQSELKQMLIESRDFRFPYVQPEFGKDGPATEAKTQKEGIDLETGMLTARQIQLIFNHLPVDITFVDELNKVRYFSSPEKRIFPRAKSIIGRDVKNCHPPESVHIVEEIIEAFRIGKQDKASFWIKMGETFLLIRYFAVRDQKNRYCGVVEVSQEISEIQQLKGEQRLLDWSANTDM